MAKFAIALGSALIFLNAAFAQSNWQEELKQDAVVIDAGKMILEDYVLITTQDAEGNALTLQGKYHAEAPESGLISRDNFLLISGMIYMPILLELGEFQDLLEPIGNVDFEINIYMASQGLQIEVKNHMENLSQRHTMKWSELFAE